MKYTKIPGTDINVSKICLGTMTFGEQNTEAEAHDQLNYAASKGVNFIDTAELYPVPGRPETQGLTEKYIGTWLKDQKREDFIIASKVTGPSEGLKYIRKNLGFSKAAIREAIEKNLRRLQTDYIDLYQLHWPERWSNYFGSRFFKKQPDEKWVYNFKAVLETLDELKKEGKIRHYGVSNETPWGLMRYLFESETHDLPRCRTIQNPYSLLNRTFEIGLSEICFRENVGLLAYSPLAFGVLSGKYINNTASDKARLKLFPQMLTTRKYMSEQAVFATKKYMELAEKNGLSLTQMALAFINQQEFVTANIIGATTMNQLKENIGSIDIDLSEEILDEIDRINELQPNPAP